MKFLCLCYYDEAQFKAMTPARLEEFVAVCKRHDPEFVASGHVDWVGSLAEPSAARTLKARPADATPKLVEGTYHPVREPAGAAFLLEAKDMEEAVRIARLHPGSHLGAFVGGGIEVLAFESFQPLRAAGDQQAA